MKKFFALAAAALVFCTACNDTLTPRVEQLEADVAELKTNLGKYLLLAATEDVYITQYGKVIAKLTSPFQNRLETAESLFGALPQALTLEEAREERLRDDV